MKNVEEISLRRNFRRKFLKLRGETDLKWKSTLNCTIYELIQVIEILSNFKFESLLLFRFFWGNKKRFSNEIKTFCDVQRHLEFNGIGIFEKKWKFCMISWNIRHIFQHATFIFKYNVKFVENIPIRVHYCYLLVICEDIEIKIMRSWSGSKLNWRLVR
jgi:hypothetical protein